MYNLGQVFSTPMCGLIMAMVSRKAALIANIIPFTIGWSFLALAEPLILDEAYWFYIGRFLMGEFFFMALSVTQNVFSLLQDWELGQ